MKTPSHIRYIKLGRNEVWAARSLDQGEIHFGHDAVPHELCATGKWDEVTQFLIANGRTPSKAKDFTREIRDFYSLGADSLWITFSRGQLWWTFAESEVHWLGRGEGHGSKMRRTIGGWKNTDATGQPLAMDTLSTRLTTTAAYRQTLCSIKCEDYLLRRLEGGEEPIIARAKAAQSALTLVAQEMIAGLHWADFEDLVDLIFARSGWQRLSRVGGTQKDIDIDLMEPATGARGFVQIKSRAGQKELDDYIGRWQETGGYEHLFFVCHKDILAVEVDLDCEVVGFDVGEVDMLVTVKEDAKSNRADAADSFVVGDGPTITSPGMTWILGTHRIRCDDARDAQAYHHLMTGHQASAVVSDPPYNVRINGHVSGRGKIKHREFAMAAGEMDPAQFIEFLKCTLGQAADCVKPGQLVYAFMDWAHTWELLSVGRDLDLELKQIATWVKSSPGQGSMYRSQSEFCLIFKRPGGRHRNNVQLGRHGRSRSNVWRYPGANNPASTGEEGRLLELHATAKPVRLIADIILDCTARNEIVLDPFCGAGSTLIAAQRVGRRCYGLELECAYVDTAVRRWQAFTGEHAVDAESGKRFDAFEPEVQHG